MGTTIKLTETLEGTELVAVEAECAAFAGKTVAEIEYALETLFPRFVGFWSKPWVSFSSRDATHVRYSVEREAAS